MEANGGECSGSGGDSSGSSDRHVRGGEVKAHSGVMNAVAQVCDMVRRLPWWTGVALALLVLRQRRLRIKAVVALKVSKGMAYYLSGTC